jgi:SulP family sulfate permease
MPSTSRRTGRYVPATLKAPRAFPLGVALRAAFKQGYSWAHLRADLMAGVVVGIVALPLSMALAIASGVPPQHGLYTAIIAGALTAATGGSRNNISGPTAAFVIVLAPVSAKFGIGGLAIASLMAGVILLVMGLARLGRLVQYVPYPVTSGFTAGIAVVIATLQLKDFLGHRTFCHHNRENVSATAGLLADTDEHWPVAEDEANLAIAVDVGGGSSAHESRDLLCCREIKSV